MPANRINWIVFYTNQSQTYGCSSKEIALATPPPTGSTVEDKRVVFITYRPDDEVLAVHPLPVEEIRNAEIAYPKPKVSTEDDET